VQLVFNGSHQGWLPSQGLSAHGVSASWFILAGNGQRTEFWNGAPRKDGEALRILSNSLKKSPLPPLCFWVWLEKSKGIPNVVEFLATCPNFMFQAALKEALQVIAYVYSSRFPNVDVNALVDFPAFTMLNSCFFSCYPDIDFKGQASVIWQELNSINRYVRPLIFPAQNPQ